MTAIERILAAVDFSDCSRAALRQAAMLAGRLGAEIEVLHVHDTAELGFADDVEVVLPGGERVNLLAHLRGEAGRALERMVEEVEELRGLRVTRRLQSGSARNVVPRRAAEMNADLVVVGTHGRRGLSRFISGSVAEHVARTANCPVLVVPGSRG